MDVTRDRVMRRFTNALEDDLNKIDAKVKIFAKNHDFSNRSLKRDLAKMTMSKRKLALNDLDAWERKRKARVLERTASINQRSTILSVLEAMTPREINKEPKADTASETDLPRLVHSKSDPKDTQETKGKGDRRGSIVLPAITKSIQQAELERELESKDKALSSPKEPVQSKTITNKDVDKNEPSEETNNAETKTPGSKLSKWKVLSKIVQHNDVDETAKQEPAAIAATATPRKRESISVSTDERKVSLSFSNHSSDDKAESMLINKWRRLSILGNGRRNSRRRSSVLSSKQIVRAFLGIMNKGTYSVGEDNNHDLSYLKNCRYLRHPNENDEDLEL